MKIWYKFLFLPILIFALAGCGKDDDDINNELPVQKKEAADTTQKNNQNNQNKNMEILPTTFDYQGNKEAEMKYGQSTKSTTEYINPIIKSDVKEPNLILEYIEPILQVHYPDGTTKSTALPARLQTEDGKETNKKERFLFLIN